ncbi:hypothetical protein Cantr_07443 [Candida viswanathii]|uniref:Uncharacterized protein n=1 Tax=Candida viswanathii TaxID=5486 RepID=A0A367XZC4_9ASCO|nr:hypothetical protein Cantr_07443 [Candida viswanathii]
MMSEKKRFGSRISSIFNHSPPPQPPKQAPPKQAPPAKKAPPPPPPPAPAPGPSRQHNTAPSSTAKTQQSPVRTVPLSRPYSNVSTIQTTDTLKSPPRTTTLTPDHLDQQSPQYLSRLGSSPDTVTSGQREKSPNPSINRLRRKPPSPSDMDSFDFGTSNSPKSGTGVTNDILADLENEIDNFLQDEGSESENALSMEPRSSNQSFQFPSSSSNADSERSNSHEINRSTPIVGLSDILNEQEGRIVNHTVPYPLDYPLSTPFDSPLDSPQIIQNEFMPITSNDSDDIEPLNNEVSPRNVISSASTVSTRDNYSPIAPTSVNVSRRTTTTTQTPSRLQSMRLASTQRLQSFLGRTVTQKTQGSSVRRISSSVGSINLASTYVHTIRRSAGTAFNELKPIKWKLPVGIQPEDKTRPMRTGLLNTSRKKTSGVELKHGHLKPRLLAAEIDEGDESTSIGLSKTATSNTTGTANTATEVQSIATTSTKYGSGSGSGSIKRNVSITSSSSSGSLSDKNFSNLGYYQHRGYRDDDDEGNVGDEADDETEDENGRVNGAVFLDANSIGLEDERPRLVLANPDTDDSD